VFWLAFVGPIGIFVYKLVSTGLGVSEIHSQGYDLVLLGLCFVQIIIRSFVIGVKYGTYTEKQYRMINEQKLSAKQQKADLLTTQWLSLSHDKILTHIEASLIRTDIEPRFVTIRPFSDMSHYTMQKFSATDFYDFDYDYVNGDKKERKTAEAYKTVREEEIKDHKIFKSITDCLLSDRVKSNADHD